MARWVWVPAKAAANLLKHKVSFDLAALVLDDPWHASRPDAYSVEERWQTIGRPSAASPVVLIVVHTAPLPETGEESEGRIISARKATPAERRAYEDGSFEGPDA